MESKDKDKQPGMQDVTRAMLDAQLEMIKKTTQGQAEAFGNFLGSLNAFTQFGAVFKTTVQKAGRVSIPEAERKALSIKEGDLVQVVVIPIRR